MAQLTAVIIIDLFSEGGVERDSGVGCDHEGGVRRRSTAGKRLDLKSRLITAENQLYLRSTSLSPSLNPVCSFPLPSLFDQSCDTTLTQQLGHRRNDPHRDLASSLTAPA